MAQGWCEQAPALGCARGFVILHPTHARAVNEAHERYKREHPRVPLDVLQVVATWLPCARTAASFAQCSTFCRDLSRCDTLWRRLYLGRFQRPSEDPPPGKWRELYRFQHTFLKDVVLNKNLDEILQRAYPRWESVGSISLPVGAS